MTWDRESQQRFLDRIAAESARLGRLVDDLLDFSAIESGTMHLQWDWCDIRLVVEAAIACLPPASAASVELTCDASLPVVWADHDRMEQVFVNLLNNAFGHNPPGTQVHVTADHRMSEVVISVLDDGLGMPQELVAAPFEAARRPRPANGHSPGHGSNGGQNPGQGNGIGNGHRKSASAGLGLSIAKGIVQAHGGRIELIPLPKGTCFRVYLPIEAEVDADRLAVSINEGDTGSGSMASASGSDGPRGRARHDGKGTATVTMIEDARKTCALVVEDDPNIVDLIRSNLAVRGFDTIVSVDGMRALQLLETEDPDIVLLDLMLPEADGFELCRQIRERSPVAIIVVSARGGERDKVTALHMGADDYLTKPFSIEELLARITATLRRTRPAAPTEQQAPPVIAVGDIVIDLALQQVRRNGQPVHLTPTEFALLRELAVNRGKLLTHAHLLRRVWGHGYETETEYLRVYVRRLRAKLEGEESAPLILTQPRAGYRLAPE